MSEIKRCLKATLSRSRAFSLPKGYPYRDEHTLLKYIGWVGYNNLGDEWIFEACAKALAPRWPFSEELGLSLQGRAYRCLGKRGQPFYSGVVLGGGTLIPHASYIDQLEAAQKENLPLIVLGTAALDPSFWVKHKPELFTDKSLRRWAHVLSQAKYIGVRDEHSRNFLSQMGIKDTETVGDLALWLGDESWRQRQFTNSPAQRPPRVGVNLGSHDPIWGSPAQLEREVEALIHGLLEQGTEVTLIPLAAVDFEVLQRLREKFDGRYAPRLLRNWKDPLGTLRCLVNQDVIIGQRLHSIIQPSAFGIPTLSLAYNPKCVNFVKSLGREKYMIRTDEIDSARALSLTEDLLSARQKHSDEIWQEVSLQRQKLQAGIEKIRSVWP